LPGPPFLTVVIVVGGGGGRLDVEAGGAVVRRLNKEISGRPESLLRHVNSRKSQPLQENRDHGEAELTAIRQTRKILPSSAGT
jgi:hypothetical protein